MIPLKGFEKNNMHIKINLRSFMLSVYCQDSGHNH